MQAILKHIIILTTVLWLLALSVQAADTAKIAPRPEWFKTKAQRWADSVYNSLTPRQRLGQLFMVAAYSNLGDAHRRQITTHIIDDNIGGLIFMQGSPNRQARLTEYYQRLCKVPLLIAMDAEWGPAMRLDSVMPHPRAMALGAADSDSLTQQAAAFAAQQLKALGVHVSFGPVADLNTNPQNPVIGTRAFGQLPNHVAKHVAAYTKGLQNNGIMAVAKHFPGHGDTHTDSHYDLPLVNTTQEQMRNREFVPFEAAINQRIGGIMVAHLHMPELIKKKKTPASLSEEVITDLLKQKLDFDGLVFTDALNMKAITDNYKSGRAAFEAFEAGADVLLFPEDPAQAIQFFAEAMEKKKIKNKDLEKRVKRILEQKFYYARHAKQYMAPRPDTLLHRLNPEGLALLNRKIMAKATTVLNNSSGLLPIKNLSDTYVSLGFGTDADTTFTAMLSKYAKCKHLRVQTAEHLKPLAQLAPNSTIITYFEHTSTRKSRNYNIPDFALSELKKLAQQHHIIIVWHGSPYALHLFNDFATVVCTYQDLAATRYVVPQLLFGAGPIAGNLPVNAGGYLARQGLRIQSLKRLGYDVPQNVGLNPDTLAYIDTLALRAIADGATPGCQILVARNGKVIYNKAFGHHDYTQTRPVATTDVYDLASVTKVAATLQAFMFLVDRGKVDVTQKASLYLPELIGTNKENLYLIDILSHQAGLLPFIPFWAKIITQKRTNTFYNEQKGMAFTNLVAPGLYSHASTEDSLWAWTIRSALRPINRQGKHDYKYSDLGFYILKRIVEKELNQPMEDFLAQNFYEPLGAYTTTFNPTLKYSIDRIVPTEVDTYFRHDTVHGTVHDPGAALMGGVGGHAGLFSNAEDLAKIMQMNLQNGYYGGQQFFEPEVIPFFTQRFVPNNRRGLGWDKPVSHPGPGPTSAYASQLSFGHSGFTGTCAWADPKHNLLYIFLSNRTYPDSDNAKLVKNNIRTNIHDVVYKAIDDFNTQNNPER